MKHPTAYYCARCKGYKNIIGLTTWDKAGSMLCDSCLQTPTGQIAPRTDSVINVQNQKEN